MLPEWVWSSQNEGVYKSSFLQDFKRSLCCRKIVTRLLKDEWKEDGITNRISSTVWILLNFLLVLKSIVTGDESLVYSYEIETKKHQSQWVGLSYRGKKKRKLEQNKKQNVKNPDTAESLKCKGDFGYPFFIWRFFSYLSRVSSTWLENK